MSPGSRAFVPALCALLVAGSLAAASPGEPATVSERRSLWQWSGVSRVVAVGDLHGAYTRLTDLLAAAGLIDGEGRWVGGTAHLVVTGDFLDRGSGDLETVELLMRLEEEAAAAGGRVHALLGNHEVMNLLRDLRYVHPETFRRLAGDESRRQRAQAWSQFRSARLGEADPRDLRVDFQRRFPPGYFARQRLFDREGRYGRWLLGLPTVVKIDGMVYLHGGLTSRVAALGVDEINRKVLTILDRHLAARDALERARAVGRAMELAELLQTAAARVEGAEPVREPAVEEPARLFLATAREEILGAEGPLWYRGNSIEDERIERGRLERSLELLDAKAMVVAHSFTGGNRITSRFQGRLFRLDHGIFESRRPLALVVEGGEVLVLDSRSGMVMRPIRELPNGHSHRAVETPTDAETEQLLAEGEVVESREIGRGSTRPKLVVVERQGSRARGVFKNVQEPGAGGEPGDRFEHEVAAYRLDRRLGLGLVPVAVVRRLDGEAGSLQSWVEGAVDREAAREHGLALDGTEETMRQLAIGAVFDALIGNGGREDSDILREVQGDRVYLIDHSEAFPSSPELPGSLTPLPALAPDLHEALARLDRAWARRELGDLLSEAQIGALLARRDRILVGSEVAAVEGRVAGPPGSDRD